MHPLQLKEKGIKKKKRIINYKLLGDSMKQFTPFYDPKSMNPPLSKVELAAKEEQILRDVEVALKQSRSSKNLNTKIKRNQHTVQIMKKMLDFIEDEQCNRFTSE